MAPSPCSHKSPAVLAPAAHAPPDRPPPEPCLFNHETQSPSPAPPLAHRRPVRIVGGHADRAGRPRPGCAAAQRCHRCAHPVRSHGHRQPAGRRANRCPRQHAVGREPAAATRGHAGRYLARAAGRVQLLLRSQRRAAVDPRAGRRPRAHPAKQRRELRRLIAQLRPQHADRSARHRACRGAARPGCAAVRWQRPGRRGQRDRQPHPARAGGRSRGRRHRARRCILEQWRCAKGRCRLDRGGQRPLRAARRCLRAKCGRHGGAGGAGVHTARLARAGPAHLQLGQPGIGRCRGRHGLFRPRLSGRIAGRLPQRLWHRGRGRRDHRHALHPRRAGRPVAQPRRPD